LPQNEFPQIEIITNNAVYFNAQNLDKLLEISTNRNGIYSIIHVFIHENQVMRINYGI